MIFGVHPLIALGVMASTAATDAAYVFFNAAVSGQRRVRAANWSAIWYLLSAFAGISYTKNATYVVFAAGGSWLGAFASSPGCDADTPETRRRVTLRRNCACSTHRPAHLFYRRSSIDKYYLMC